MSYINNIKTLTKGNKMFKLNQIVKGKKAGTFVIIGFRKINNEDYAQLKEVNPKNYIETAIGEIVLPLTSISIF